MKKVILTIAALLVAAVMVFAFAGCAKEANGDAETTDAAGVTVADESAEVGSFAAVVESDSVAA